MDTPARSRQLAITAATLYLLNLLLLPGLAFAALAILWWKQRRHAGMAGKVDVLAGSHLESAFRGSLLAGVLLLGVTAAIALLGGYANPGTWVVLIIYFVTAHAALVLAGVVALTRALASQPFRFPLAGIPAHE